MAINQEVVTVVARKFKCHDCGEPLKTREERQLRLDPYLDEIKNEQKKAQWCKKCYQEMLNEI